MPAAQADGGSQLIAEKLNVCEKPWALSLALPPFLPAHSGGILLSQVAQPL